MPLFLVDGYNVTRSDPATRGLPLERQRDALVARLSTRGRDLLGEGAIVVVFDGTGEAGISSTNVGGVQVLFSRDESADNVLVRRAARASGSVCLVSADRELAARVGTHAGGVEVRGPESVFEANRTRRQPRPCPARSAGIPDGANAITEELKKVWLGEGED